MIVKFCICGRLGNAIFRYLACSIICLYYDASYEVNYISSNSSNSIQMTDERFTYICDQILQKHTLVNLNNNFIVDMSKFYQHDLIYKTHKPNIINFIKNNPSHYVLAHESDEKYNMINILNTPLNFNKVYKNVLHVRLEDFVIYNLYLDKNRIIELLKKNIIQENLCIVCKQPTTEFENEYIKYITDFLSSININYYLEHNDVLTDFYIMKESTLLICSKSTLSWCAAFFSNKIQKFN